MKQAFHQQSYARRFDVLGDIAEPKFEEWARANNIAFVRFGYNRPPFKRDWQIAEHIRLMPDYLCEPEKGPHFLVEVKGCKLKRRKGDEANADIKIKEVTLNALEEWHSTQHVYFWIYDSGYKMWTFVPLDHIEAACLSAEKKQFETDNKWYYSLSRDKFSWKSIGELL